MAKVTVGDEIIEDLKLSPRLRSLVPGVVSMSWATLQRGPPPWPGTEASYQQTHERATSPQEDLPRRILQLPTSFQMTAWPTAQLLPYGKP